MSEKFQLRPVIFFSILGCLAIALAPWLTGGREPLAMALSSSALLLGLLLLWLQPRVPSLKLNAAYAVFLGFLVWGGLSLIWSVNRYSTIEWLYLWGSVPAVFYLVYVVAICENGRTWLLKTYLVSAATFSLYGLWLYFTSPYDRLTGSFYWPNPAAAYLMPAVIIALGNLGRGKGSWRWSTAAVFFGATFALTDSRAAALVIVLACIILLFVNRSKKYWLHFLFTVAAMLMVTLSIARLATFIGSANSTKTFGSRYSAAGAGESTSISDRLSYLRSVAAIFENRPVFGSGAGSFKDMHPAYQKGVTDASSDAHDVYAQTLAELGLVGFLLLILGLGLSASVVYETSLSQNGQLITLSILTLVLHFGLDIDATYPALLWLLVALVALQFASTASGENTTDKKAVRFALVLFQILVGFIGYSIFRGESLAACALAVQSDGDYYAAADFYAQAEGWPIYNPDWLNNEGIDRLTLASQGDLADVDSALALAKKSEAADRFDAQHYQLEGRVLEAEGKAAAAAAAFRKAISLDPNNRPEYFSDLVSLLWVEHKNAEALKMADGFLSKYSSVVIANRSTDDTLRPALANLYGMAGQIYLESHNIIEAKKYAGLAIRTYPQSLRGRALQNQLKKNR